MYPSDQRLASYLANAWQADLFAVVPDNGTADRLRAGIPSANIVCATLSDLRISHGSMSVAVVELPDPSNNSRANNPHDLLDLNDGATPQGILRRAALALAPGGLLLAAIPVSAFTIKLWHNLSTWFEVFGLAQVRDRHKTTGIVVAGRLLDGYAPFQLRPLPDLEKLPFVSAPSTPFARLPVAPKGQVLFSATGLTWAQALTEGRQHGVWRDPAVAARLAPDFTWNVQPLMPLARGHLGQLIACGAFNNALLRGADGPVLLKGQTRKIKNETENTTEPDEKGQPPKHRTTMRDAFKTVVTLLHLRTGEIETVHSEDANGDNPQD